MSAPDLPSHVTCPRCGKRVAAVSWWVIPRIGWTGKTRRHDCTSGLGRHTIDLTDRAPEADR